jgi:hypothetical protein
MDVQAPMDWRALCKAASTEQDTEKLIKLAQQINEALLSQLSPAPPPQSDKS